MERAAAREQVPASRDGQARCGGPKMAPRCCWLLGALVLAGAQLSQIERSQASWRPESSSSSKSNLEDLTRSAESASAEQPANNEKPFGE